MIDTVKGIGDFTSCACDSSSTLSDLSLSHCRDLIQTLTKLMNGNENDENACHVRTSSTSGGVLVLEKMTGDDASIREHRVGELADARALDADAPACHGHVTRWSQ